MDGDIIMATAEQSGVVLQLSSTEAQTLVEILARVGGNDSRSARKHADSIRVALGDLGYYYTYDAPFITGGITFGDV